MFCYGYTRHDIAFAYAWYDLLWSPTRYGQRLHRLGVKLGVCARLETEDSGVKQIYGSIVRREHRLYVGFGRLKKKMGDRLSVQWPGTNNMPKGEWAWLKSEGLLDAVLAQVGDTRESRSR